MLDTNFKLLISCTVSSKALEEQYKINNRITDYINWVISARLKWKCHKMFIFAFLFILLYYFPMINVRLHSYLKLNHFDNQNISCYDL